MSSSKLFNSWDAFFPRRTRTFFVLFQIVVFVWLVALSLHYFVTIESSSAPVKPPRNIFEHFNYFHNSVFSEDDEMADDPVPFNKSKQHLTKLDQYRLTTNPLLPKPDCVNVIKGDQETIEESALLNLELRSTKYKNVREKLKGMEKDLQKLTTNCTEFLSVRKYFSQPLTSEEKSYPLAYIITIHNQFSSFERLLRSVYHPQNVYCVHVDKKSPPEFIEKVRKLVGCFPNVFVSSKLSEVHYSHWSRVQADINCFHDLIEWSNKVAWKYVLNLCGQDFPLKTNLEIVRSLKAIRGYNNLETVTMPSHKKKRYEFHYKLPSKDNDHAVMEKTGEKKAPSPIDSPMFAGSAYYAWKRDAVKFMLKDASVQKFFVWNEDSYSPDEHMWASLQRWYPHVPGSFPPHGKYDLNELQSFVRLVKWAGLDTSVYPKCAGQFRRGVCVYGIGDLPWLLQQHHLFANKFDSVVDPFAIECLDIWLRNRTLTQTAMYLRKGFV